MLAMRKMAAALVWPERSECVWARWDSVQTAAL